MRDSYHADMHCVHAPSQHICVPTFHCPQTPQALSGDEAFFASKQPDKREAARATNAWASYASEVWQRFHIHRPPPAAPPPRVSSGPHVILSSCMPSRDLGASIMILNTFLPRMQSGTRGRFQSGGAHRAKSDRNHDHKDSRWGFHIAPTSMDGQP